MTGGEIGKTRQELKHARIQGVKRIAIRIALILLAVWLMQLRMRTARLAEEIAVLRRIDAT